VIDRRVVMDGSVVAADGSGIIADEPGDGDFVKCDGQWRWTVAMDSGDGPRVMSDRDERRRWADGDDRRR
jgi:hypothetical protein